MHRCQLFRAAWLCCHSPSTSSTCWIDWPLWPACHLYRWVVESISEANHPWSHRRCDFWCRHLGIHCAWRAVCSTWTTSPALFLGLAGPICPIPRESHALHWLHTPWFWSCWTWRPFLGSNVAYWYRCSHSYLLQAGQSHHHWSSPGYFWRCRHWHLIQMSACCLPNPGEHPSWWPSTSWTYPWTCRRSMEWICRCSSEAGGSSKFSTATTTDRHEGMDCWPAIPLDLCCHWGWIAQPQRHGTCSNSPRATDAKPASPDSFLVNYKHLWHPCLPRERQCWLPLSRTRRSWRQGWLLAPTDENAPPQCTRHPGSSFWERFEPCWWSPTYWRRSPRTSLWCRALDQHVPTCSLHRFQASFLSSIQLCCDLCGREIAHCSCSHGLPRLLVHCCPCAAQWQTSVWTRTLVEPLQRSSTPTHWRRHRFRIHWCQLTHRSSWWYSCWPTRWPWGCEHPFFATFSGRSCTMSAVHILLPLWATWYMDKSWWNMEESHRLCSRSCIFERQLHALRGCAELWPWPRLWPPTCCCWHALAYNRPAPVHPERWPQRTASFHFADWTDSDLFCPEPCHPTLGHWHWCTRGRV